MTVYNVKLDVYFDGADQDDAWAQGVAESIVTNARALAEQAALVAGATDAERQSWAGSFAVQPDGTLVLTLGWQNSVYGVIDNLDDVPVPEVNEWSSAGVSYAIDDFVTYNGNLYRCIQAHPSQVGWEPDVATSLWTAV